MTAVVWTWIVALASVLLMLWGAAIIERSAPGERIGYWVLGLASAGAVCAAMSLWRHTGVFG